MRDCRRFSQNALSSISSPTSSDGTSATVVLLERVQKRSLDNKPQLKGRLTRMAAEPLYPARKPIERRNRADNDIGVFPLKNLLSQIVELGVGGVYVRVHVP